MLNVSQPLGLKLIYIGSSDPTLTGQQPDQRIWKMERVPDEESKAFFITKDVSNFARFFTRKQTTWRRGA